MVTMVVMTVWIRRVYGGEKDQDVDEVHEKNEGRMLTKMILYLLFPEFLLMR